ncbi:MAG: hypothetical protein ACR2KU_05770 [Gammaproteobacteria bacterium]
MRYKKPTRSGRVVEQVGSPPFRGRIRYPASPTYGPDTRTTKARSGDQILDALIAAHRERLARNLGELGLPVTALRNLVVHDSLNCPMLGMPYRAAGRLISRLAGVPATAPTVSTRDNAQNHAARKHRLDALDKAHQEQRSRPTEPPRVARERRERADPNIEENRRRDAQAAVIDYGLRLRPN